VCTVLDFWDFIHLKNTWSGMEYTVGDLFLCLLSVPFLAFCFVSL